jgi:hypothetical protein
MRKPEEEESFDTPRQRWYAVFKMDRIQDVKIWTGFIWTEIEISVRPFSTYMIMALQAVYEAEVLLAS